MKPAKQVTGKTTLTPILNTLPDRFKLTKIEITHLLHHPARIPAVVLPISI